MSKPPSPGEAVTDPFLHPRLCRLLSVSTILVIVGSMGIDAHAQTQKSQADVGLGYNNETTQKWEMGLEIRASGTVNGITAVFPVPIDWPEQKVKVLSQDKSAHVSRISIRFVDSKKTCKIAIVSIPRLPAGATAKATILFEIKKSRITEPVATSQFQFSKKAKRTHRTYLGTSPFIETTHPRIKAVAQGISFRNESAWQDVESIFKWVRENIDYEFDEKIQSCITALENYKGDCEELSSIFIAICRSKGIPARAVWIPGHTYPEFYLEDKQGNGHWIPCQVAGGNNDFGRMPEDKPILQKGDRFKIPGHSKLQRYARPTLSARSATSSPSLKWILEKKSM